LMIITISNITLIKEIYINKVRKELLIMLRN